MSEGNEEEMMGVNAPARDAAVNSSDIKVLCQGHSAFQSAHAGGALWDLLGFSKHPGPVLGLAQRALLHRTPKPHFQEPRRTLLSSPWFEGNKIGPWIYVQAIG